MHCTTNPLLQVTIAILAAILALTSAHHDPRHIDEKTDSEIPNPESIFTSENLETEVGQPEIRHHIYMPFPMTYRQSSSPPVIKYVPVYTDPRLLNFQFGANANLGFAR